MSRLSSVSGSESFNPVSMEEGVNENLLDDKLKKDVKDSTDLSKIEKLNSETTAHKAGRIIAGILGGLLLAAGIAAATVAVTATFGVAVGVLGTLAAFAGITASGIAAAAAGCAGIGLITTSALLAPKDPSAMAESDSAKAENKISDFSQNTSTQKQGSIKFGADQLEATEEKLEAKGMDSDKINNQSFVAWVQIATLTSVDLNAGGPVIDTRKNPTWSDNIARIPFNAFRNIKDNLTSDDLKDDNVLLLKQSLNIGLEKVGRNAADDFFAPVVNSKSFQESIQTCIREELANLEPTSEKYIGLMLTMAVFSEKSIEELKLENPGKDPNAIPV